MRRRTPQEKKRLSLEKDRRNAYGENDKASRKGIPRAKARVNRANRRATSATLTGPVARSDDGRAAERQEAVAGRLPKSWRKWPDRPLGRLIAGRSKADDLPFDPSERNPYTRRWTR